MDDRRHIGVDSRVDFANEIILKLNDSYTYWYTSVPEVTDKPYFDKNQTLELLEVFRICNDSAKQVY